MTGCLLNYHEGVRTQATSWIPFAWMPVYDEKLAPNRPARGYQSHTPRRIRLDHEALSHIFKDWDVRTRESMQLYWENSASLQGIFGSSRGRPSSARQVCRIWSVLIT